MLTGWIKVIGREIEWGGQYENNVENQAAISGREASFVASDFCFPR